MNNPLHVLAPDPYPRFKGEKLFLASSSDLRHVRHQAQAMLGKLLNRLVTERRIEPYEWETCVAELPFDQRLTMQENLGRPSDPNCAGVICLLGERIGFPLRDVDTSTIVDWDKWSDEKRRYHVVYDWPENKLDQLELVKKGGFPLSGVVFEVLDALGAEQLIHIAYFADREVTADDTDILLNGGYWQNQILKQINSREKRTEWFTNDYLIQTGSVTNFLNALNERRRGVPFHKNVQEALDAIQTFVETRVAPIRLIEDNPYRFLDFYEIGDADDLYGREDVTDDTLVELLARASDPDRTPMIARITGESGCGKTSFLRAGVLAGLVRPRELDRFRVVAVRPTDFHDDEGRPDGNVPARLLEIIAREITDLGLSARDVNNVVRAGPAKSPALAVDVLVRALAAKGEQTALVIGLDQFEEIVDDLAAIDRRRYGVAWKPLLSFVELAVKTGRFGFVYTLESSRLEAFEKIPLPKVFRDAHDVHLGGNNDAFLESIITKPFERAGYRLAPKIVNDLLTNYKKYSEPSRGYASTLPLLALKLSHLFDTVQTLRGGRRPGPTASDGLQSKFMEPEQEISYEDVKVELDLDNWIEELANSAWADKIDDESIDDLNMFLKPLVALSEDWNTITLQTVGDVLLINLEEKLAAFEDVRLVIREGGRRRLAHEAVVRQWPFAAKWLEKKRDYMVEEAKFLAEANYWVAKGEPQELLPSNDTSLDMAAAILRSYVQEWPYCDQAGLSSKHRNLKKYCLAVFQQSTTPTRSQVHFFRHPYRHIHIAAEYGLTDLIDKFLTTDPESLNVLTDDKRTPLDLAVWVSSATTRFLIDKGANPVNFDEDGWSTISIPVWRKDLDTFRILLPHYRNAESVKAPGGMNLLHITARRGAVDIASALLATVDGLDPMQEDAQGLTPLHRSAFWDQPEAFHLFLKHCDVQHQSANGWSVLHCAALRGSLKVIEELIRLPEFPELLGTLNANGENALMIAAKERHDAVVRRLLEYIDPNEQVQDGKAREGWTALHFAIAGPEEQKRETRLSRQQALRTVRALLTAPNIDPTIRAGDGKQPLTLASALPHVCRELISHPKFAQSERLGDGSTPLNFMIAAKDRANVERMLDSADLDLELLNSDGTYVLTLLIENDMQDVALRLLEAERVNPWNVVTTKDNGLAAAVFLDNKPLIAAYLEKLPATRNESSRRYLSLAVKATLTSGRTDRMDTFVELGADPTLPLDSMEWTLFHFAALVGNVEAFDKLAQQNSATSPKDSLGRLPADLAPDHVRPEFESRMK